MRKYFQATAALGLMLMLNPTAVRSQDSTLLNRAREFLENENRAKAILFFAYPEAKYQSIKPGLKQNVTDARGNTVAGQFALIYIYSWKSGFSGDNNTTEFAFFFDQKGRFFAVKGGKTTSFFRPFELTNLVVQHVADEINRYVDQSGSEADKNLVRVLIEGGDARGLLTFCLKAAQP